MRVIKKRLKKKRQKWLSFSFYLQCDYSNLGTWKKIIQSQRFLKTNDSQVFLQADQ